MSLLPCHAKCLLTDVAAELVRQYYRDPETRMCQAGEDFGVPDGVIRATLHHRCDIPMRP